eukprot:13475165-Ditylum_brightwellii.AAC.1
MRSATSAGYFDLVLLLVHETPFPSYYLYQIGKGLHNGLPFHIGRNVVVRRFFRICMISAMACALASLSLNAGVAILCGMNLTVSASTSVDVSGMKHLIQQ